MTKQQDKKMSLVLVITVILILVILLAGGIMIYQRWQSSKEIPTPPGSSIIKPGEFRTETYIIDSRKVKKAEFEEMKSKLDISKKEKYTAPLEPDPHNPESEVGVEVGYSAVDRETGKNYTYIEIDYPSRKDFEIREVK